MYSKLINGIRKVTTDGQGIVIVLEDGRAVSNPTIEQLIENGWQEYTPPEPEPYVPLPQTEADLEDKVNALIALSSIGSEVVALDDEAALTLKALFPTLVSMYGNEVKSGERYFWDNRLWKVNQTHTPQEGWRPDELPALYTEVQVIEWPEWVQPTGQQDAYMSGDKVSHSGRHWTSDVDNNVWEPGAYGWTQED